jgi:MFS family permease
MWLTHTTPLERRTLVATSAGYGVDSFDYMIYTFIIPTLISVWGLTKAEAGYIATVTLLTSAAGGWGAGVLADRHGRVRVLQITVAWFALFTFLSGFTHSFGQLMFTRALQGFGFGGEWSVGSVLIAETIAARNRGKAAGLVQSSWAVGWAAAALAFWGVYALVPPELGWKILLWIGVLPAFLILYVRRSIVEPPVYLKTRAQARSGAAAGHWLSIFHPPLLRTTLLATLLSAGLLGAYYSVTTWLPTYLKLERHLSVTGTTSYLLVLIAGAFTGYIAGAWLTDALGRRRSYVLFAICALLLVLAYTRIPITDGQMLALGFPLGFLISGINSGTGAFFAELFPNAVRGSGQGFCYAFGRAIGGGCPAVVGLLSERMPLGLAIGAMSAAAFGVVMVAALALPETRGRALVAEAGAAA